MDFGIASRKSYAWLAKVIRTTPHTGPLRLVAVDGGAGSGKSTFARHLSQALAGAPIIPIDDFLAWDDLEDFWPRLVEQVLNPLLEGRSATYQARDWDRDPYGRGLGPWKIVSCAPVIILEGVGAARRQVRDQLAFSIWVETDPAIRLQRGVERDGEAHRPRWLEWQAREASFFEKEPNREHADLVVDGERSLGSDEFLCISEKWHG